MSEVVLQIVEPDFVAGIVVRDRIVVETAPKVREIRGWRLDWVWPHCRRKGWKVESVAGKNDGQKNG